MHPLLDSLIAATKGEFPPIDGGVAVVPPLERGWECSVAFTGHAVIATGLPTNDILQQGADGFGGSLAPDFLRWMAGRRGLVGVTDVMLFARGTGNSSLALRADLDDHPRVRHAIERRSAVAVYGDERGEW